MELEAIVGLRNYIPVATDARHRFAGGRVTGFHERVGGVDD